MPGEEGVRSGYVTPHVESYESTRTGELIRVSCHCAICSNHTYAEWLNLLENASISLETSTQVVFVPFHLTEEKKEIVPRGSSTIYQSWVYGLGAPLAGVLRWAHANSASKNTRINQNQ